MRTVVAILMAGALLCAGSASHAGEIGLKAIEARLGFADLDGGGGSTFIVSGGADLGRLTPDLGLDVGVDFWTKNWGEDYGYLGDAYDWDWTWTNIGFLCHLRYDFVKEGSFRPYGYGGLGLHYWSVSWDCTGCESYGWDYDESGIELGFDVGAAAEFGSGEGMTPVARAGYNSNGGADYLYIQGGLRFPVGR